MAGNPTALSAHDVIALCEQGIYQSHDGTEPVDLLARGIIESATGDLETAKDLLSQAYWTLDDGWKTKCGVQLAIAYWRGGESSEAWALLETLPIAFDVLLSKAIICTDADPDKALGLLTQAQKFDVSRFMLGRLHNQRGMCFRLLGNSEQAREEYEAALYFFGDCPLRALVENNLAGVQSTNDAHKTVDKAIDSLSGPHLGQAYERKARTYLSEGEIDRAERYATWAVDLLAAANRRAWLFEALFTRAEINVKREHPGEAISDLCRAYEIASYLNDAALALRATKEIYAVSKLTSKIYHIRSVEIALDVSDSLSSAARRLNTSRPTLQEFIRTNNLHHKLRPRRSIFTKN